MQENGKSVDPDIQYLIPMAKGIAETFGKYCEVAVHDLRQPETSLVYVAGSVTRRLKGAPITNLVLEKIRNFGDNCPDLIGYKNISKEGRILKSTTIFARNKEGQIIGCLCINYDITNLLNNQDQLESIVSFGDKAQLIEGNEIFATDITDVLESMVNQAIKKLGVSVTHMRKEEKSMLVHELDHKGIFLVKGAVDKVAAMLGVSRYTIYNYLDQERSRRINNIV